MTVKQSVAHTKVLVPASGSQKIDPMYLCDYETIEL